MKAPLQILHVEDNPNDSELTAILLKTAGIECAIKRAKTAWEVEQALDNQKFDLIISDFSMPGFNGLAALKIARQKRPDVPFIFLSGTIGEELAVEALKQGATDYVLKDRLSRLPSSVQRAVQQATEATARQQMEERIREQATLLDRAQDAICLHSVWQKILYWNKSAERLYGWTSDEIMGRNIQELLAPDDQLAQASAMKKLLGRGEWQGDLQQVTKDGTTIIVESRWTLMRDEQGEPKSVLIINTDVTDRKRLEAQCLRNQRLETIGALAGGIAHDLSNSLTPVLMGVGVLRAMPIPKEVLPMLDLMENSARHSVNMAKQILSFSRGISGHPVVLDVSHLVRDIAELARQTFPRSIAVQPEIASELPPVLGNATQLHQVLLNLCINARDAMPQGGMLKIEAGNIELSSDKLPHKLGLSSGRYIFITVSDTGNGIPPELLKKIFEPFFTTKEPGKGTGLGLSTAMGIIKTHNGFLEVASEVGRGTSFKVHLPVTLVAKNPVTRWDTNSRL